MNTLIITVPFLVGLGYLLVVVFYRFFKWIRGLSKIDKLRLYQSFKGGRVLKSAKESIKEGLLHQSIFKTNPVLGYMHMSLAFGWFLLIVVGHFEAMVAEKSLMVPMYLPVFFRYFHQSGEFFLSGAFSFTMDLLLLFVISGLSLAIMKRFKKSIYGLKRTTKLKTGDRIALATLWLIFPLRLLSESISANLYGNGHFLTNTVGSLFQNVESIESLQTMAWVAYSSALGLFFVALPNSRYMHIPTEILYIFLRNAGIKLKKRINTYTDVQVFSCSRCGICLNNCPLTTAGIDHSQSVYVLKNIRNNNLTDENLFNCLLCGKCQVDCPVGIDITGLRLSQRIESTRQYNSSYDYLETGESVKAEVIYFAGCMTHLTPGIIQSMKTVFAECHENYWFLDAEKAPCCGRPLMLAGQYEAASNLIANNSEKILGSGAKKLVVSCPICYKVFKEDYDLPNVEVVMHFDYILDKIANGKLTLNFGTQRLVYHDPCELGRGMGVYEPPRQLLNLAGTVVQTKFDNENSLCCGGSLGNLKIKQTERGAILNQAVGNYLSYAPDVLVTSCPMCKKTFARANKIPVLDIVEIVAQNLKSEHKKTASKPNRNVVGSKRELIEN